MTETVKSPTFPHGSINDIAADAVGRVHGNVAAQQHHIFGSAMPLKRMHLKSLRNEAPGAFTTGASIFVEGYCLLDGQYIEVVDVGDNTLAPSARYQFRSFFVQQPGNLTGEVCFAP